MHSSPYLPPSKFGIQVGHSKFDQIEFTVCLQVLCSIVLEYHNAEPGQYKISVWISCDESAISMFDPCHFVCCLYENGGWYILQQHVVVRNSFFFMYTQSLVFTNVHP